MLKWVPRVILVNTPDVFIATGRDESATSNKTCKLLTVQRKTHRGRTGNVPGQNNNTMIFLSNIGISTGIDAGTLLVSNL